MSLAAKASVKSLRRGGVEPAGSGNYSERKDKNRATKLRIAQQCARLVKPGGTIFIDTGTTNLAMAEALPAELALTVVTNSPEIAAVLVKKPLYDVVMLGGQVQRASGGCVGAAAVAQVQGCYSTRVYRRLRHGARVRPDRF